MPQQLLHRPDVVAIRQEVNGEGVPQLNVWQVAALARPAFLTALRTDVAKMAPQIVLDRLRRMPARRRRSVRPRAHSFREVQVLSRHTLSGLKPKVTAPS